MELIDLISLIIEQYGPVGWAAGFLALKGCAAIIANNFHTEEYGKVGKVIEWLASSNKKAKLVGDPILDAKILGAVKDSKPVKKINRILNIFS